MNTSSTKKERPQILITNDDGVDSIGLWLLADNLAEWADVFIVAPATEQSGKSLSISVYNPLEIQRLYESDHKQAWSVSGTPADCVKTALSILLKTAPDIVVSGINRGSNAGKNVLYSGTIGGAIEASLRGLQAIAFSSYSMENPAFELYAPLTSKIVQYNLKNPSENGVVLNINFPCPRTTESSAPVKGLKLARQGKEYILENPRFISSPREMEDHHQTSFHLGGRLVHSHGNSNETDIHWLNNGYATCVPIFIEDLTHDRYLNSRKNEFETIL